MKPLTAETAKGGYVPTEEDKKNLLPNPDAFKLTGDGVFHTIQGEGNRAGRHTTFIRLHFCNLQCSRCDARYSRKRDTEEYYKEPFDIAISDMHTMIRKAQQDKGISEENHVWNVTFTGGEPLLQHKKIQRFMEEHPEYTVQIETNGTLVPSQFLIESAKFNCSPKIKVSGNKEMFTRNTEAIKSLVAGDPDNIFKFVFRTTEDIDEVIERYSELIPKDKIRMMPEGVTKEENAAVFENTIDYILSKGLNVTVRAQNIMWEGAKRGV